MHLGKIQFLIVTKWLKTNHNCRQFVVVSTETITLIIT